MVIALFLACAAPPPAQAPLDPGAVLVRASLDLTGVRPSPEQLQAVQEDPDLLPAALDELVHDDRLGARVRDLWALFYQTRLDGWPLSGTDLGLPEDQDRAFRTAVGEEPLRLLSEVAEQDLPWTTIVTADWTMVDETLAATWPVHADPSQVGWRRATWTDGRPAAGVLASNGLWWRYKTSWNNANRGRAAALARLLLCHDYLAQPVRFDSSLDLSQPDAIAQALTENPGCVSCHNSLDPLAGFLGGFYWEAKARPEELVLYHPEREGLWRELSGVPPAYYGQPGETVGDLARAVAADPRFVDCAVEQAFEALLQRAPTAADTEALTAHREAFLAGGLALRPLLASIVSDAEYQQAVGEGVEGTGEATGHAVHLASPELLESQVQALTGFVFEVEGASLLRTDEVGVRTIAGGVDGELATVPVREPTPGLVLVQQRIAEAAARHAVAAWQQDPEAVPWVADMDLGAAPSTDDLALLELRALSRRSSAAEQQELLDFWTTLAASADPVTAWQGLLTVLLRDPDLLLY